MLSHMINIVLYRMVRTTHLSINYYSCKLLTDRKFIFASNIKR